MRFIIRYAHLKSRPAYETGDIIPGWTENIAVMGNTGQSTGAHLHIDIVEEHGTPVQVYRMSEIMGMITDLEEVMRQHHYFIDSELFGVEPVITTSFGDPHYRINGKWKFHPAFDVVPADRHITESHFGINWNRSMSGKVVGVGYDSGYGNYLMVAYNA